MAWEWVTPLATATVGVVGTVATYMTARAGRRHAEEVSRASNAHAELMARDERTQERRATAYIEILKTTNMIGHKYQFDQTEDNSGADSSDQPPSAEEFAMVAALAAAFGSKEVRSMVKIHRSVISDFIFAKGTLEILTLWEDFLGVNKSGEKDQIRAQIRQVLRPRELAAREQLEHQIAAELGTE